MDPQFLTPNGLTASRESSGSDRSERSVEMRIPRNPKFKNDPTAILYNPIFNKGTSFPLEERQKYHLRGLVPPVVESLEEQVERAMMQLDSFEKPLHQYIYLNSLQRTNQTLFYATLASNLERCLPIVYTPTVGQACQEFAHIIRGMQGVYISAEHDKGHIREILDNWPADDVEIIVVTDGSRILGLGDLGVNGMGIPIGKLSLYVAAAGFHPARTLPITIDMGTNNEMYRKDPLYIGSRSPRVDDEEFFAVMEEFMQAVQERWPRCLVQFEDFSTDHAFDLLRIHRDRFPCFNDDIQGTAAVILAGWIAATKMIKRDLRDHRVVFFGAGSAGVGIAEHMVMYLQRLGLTEEEARSRFWLVDTKGLITTTRGDKLAAHKVSFARNDATVEIKTLEEVVRAVKPTCLFGLSTTPHTFTEEICKMMAEFNERPIIFPLSNPTSKSECTAEEAYKWTNGKAVFAAGSPFKPVELNGTVYRPGQGNNLYIFPGLGLGASAIAATKVSDSMVLTSAETLASMVTDEEMAQGLVYPTLDRVREISAHIATAVAQTAINEGYAEMPDDAYDGLLKVMQYSMYTPVYEPLEMSEACCRRRRSK